MDIFSHALMGSAIAPSPEFVWPMAFSGVIPDMWTLPPLTEYLWRKRGRFNNQEFWTTISPRYTQLTRWSHSLIPLLVAMLIGLSILQWSIWIFVPWLLHLLVDIPTHATTRTGYLLYPLTEWKPRGYKNWYEMWWLSVLCFIVFGLIVYRRFVA